MSFVSLEFVIFIVVMFVMFWSIPDNYRWELILLGNYLFYAFAGIQYLLLIIYVTVAG